MILEHKGVPVFYTDEGQGSAIILLHGFLEDSSMWHPFISDLTKKNRVITIDLLGHGKTGCLGYIHTMEDHAVLVFKVLKHLKLRRYIMVGHSMGGYIALAYAKLYSKHIKGLCLMNSTYDADDADRKLLRTRANKMITKNFDNMVRLSFANLFSSESKMKHKKEFEAALNTALQTSIQGYIANQEGMKLREDSSLFFAKAPFKKTIFLGKKDPILNYETIQTYCKKHEIATALFSEGHMSHIENKSIFLHNLMHFIEKI